MAKEKTRAGGTMTDSTFFSYIRSVLRKASMRWKPIQDCKKGCRKPYTGDNKRMKWIYQCSMCKKYYANDDIVVDHTIPVGSLISAKDLPEFVENLFCEVDNLSCMCKSCHNEKSIKDNSNTRQKRK